MQDKLSRARPSKCAKVFHAKVSTNKAPEQCPRTMEDRHLKLLVRRAYIVSNKDYLLKMELDYLKDTFMNINNYSKILINKIIKQVNDEQTVHNSQPQQQRENPQAQTEEKIIQLTLPYAGKKGENQNCIQSKKIELVL